MNSSVKGGRVRHWPQVLLLIVAAMLVTPPALGADAIYETSLISRVQTAFAERPAGDAAEYHRICGTMLIYEIWQAWPSLSDQTRLALSSMAPLERPPLDEMYDTPDGTFRIHFTRTGTHAINMTFGTGAGNVPVYILNCAGLLDRVYKKEVDTLGFRVPVPDQTRNPAEDARFDVYFQKLSSDFYGLTFPESTVVSGGGQPIRATSYMILQSDFTRIPNYQNRPFDAMAVTIAHEFHHSSQWAYDAFEGEIRGQGNDLP